MKRHALFVGVDQYVDGHIPNLSCAVSDATDLHGFFKYGAGYDQVELLPNPSSKKEVLGKVRSLTAGLGPGDFFLFFFAGHGFRVGENHVLVCSNDLYDDVKYEDDGLRLGQLKRRLSGAFDSALLLDACQSDILATRGGEGIAERDLSLIHEAPVSEMGGGALTVVTSCDAGQTAAELSERRHGLFTVAMLDLLKEAQRTHVRLDLSDAFRLSLGRRMGEIAGRFGLPTEQRPRFSCTGNSCFILFDGVASASAVQAALPMSTQPHPVDHARTGECGGECAEEGVAFLEKSKKLRGVMQFDSGYLSKYFITDPKPMECVMEDPFILIFEGGISDAQAMLSFLTYVAKTGHPLLIIAGDVGDEVLKMLVEKKLRGYCLVCAVKAPDDCRTELLEDVAVVTGGMFVSKDLNIRLQDIQTDRLGRAKKLIVTKDSTILIGGRGTPENIKERVEMIKWQIDEAVSGDDRDSLRERISKLSCEEFGAAQRLYIQAEKYYRGKNFAKAFEFYQRAAKKGEAEAAYSLGRMFKDGEGVAKNNEKALFWYRRAAVLGCERSVRCVKVCEEEGIKDLKAKALQGDADAQYALGQKFHDGDDVEQDYEEALKWYRMAAEDGHADAQYSLGVMYDLAEGVDKDYEEAMTWYLRAAVQGHAPAHEALEEMLLELSESEDGAETAEAWCDAVWDRGNEDEIEIVKKIKAENEEEQDQEPEDEEEQSTPSSSPEQSEGDSDAATEWVPRDEEKCKSWDFIREAAAGIEGSSAFPHVLLGDDCLIDYAISSETSALLLEVLPFSCDYGVVDEDTSPASDEVSLAFVAKLLKAKAVLGKQSDAHVSIGVFASQATIQDIRSMIADSKFKDVHLEYLTCANFTTQVKRVLNDQQAGEQDERQDDVHGICEQATNYYRGLNGVKEDHARAVELYKIAAARGDVTAQTIVGVAYYNGDGVAQDYAEAVKWLRKAAERGSVQAQCLLGACYKQGEGVSQDNREAVRWFRLAAEKGDAQSQRCLGMCYQAGEGVPQDHAAAVKWFRSAAEQGDVKAECFLAACYVSGKGVSRDFDEAERWARKAADQGEANAISLLALIELMQENNNQDDETQDDETQDEFQSSVQDLYEQAENYYCGQNGVKEDRARAFELYQKAAAQGHAESQYSLGYMYANGDGVAKDAEKAFFWYCKAAAQGHEKAARMAKGLEGRIATERKNEQVLSRQEQDRLRREQLLERARQGGVGELCRLADKYYEGDGVEEDCEEAARLFRMAAEQGYAYAQYSLGYMYENGEGVDEDFYEAVEWYCKSAEQGYEDARDALENLKDEMVADEGSTLGECLRAARLAKGYSFEEVASKTHMLVEIAQEMENGDFHRISTPIYGRGFVRLYADCVGLDPDPLLKKFMDEYNAQKS